ncbi:MAG: type II secretion system F family protein [Alphaproteobacteria bacterium]|jgi:tight adherence protein B|nr:type II secretion system F family protein [Alphaproteobacteria bacterium]
MLQSLLAPGGSSTIFFVVAAIVGLCVIGLTLLVVLVQASKRARFKRRMNTVLGIQKASKQGGKGQQRRLLIQGKLDEIEGTRKKSTTRASLRQRIEMAGFDFTPKKFYMASAGLALGTLLTVLIMRVGILPALLASATMGLGLPRLVLSYQAARRRGKFIQNFADAVDVIVRGLQSGLPLGECMNVIASEAEEPVCTEFRMVMESTRLGLPLTEALQRGVGRIDVAEFNFFSIVLSIQAETGGNLAETLSNLSGILRQRKQMKDKVKAMSSEARTTAGIIGSLPFIMAGILWLTSPDYLSRLFTESAGNIMIVGGLVSMSIGIAVMSKMISFKI